MEFPLEEGQEDAYTTAKVACLSWIAAELRRQVEELKVRHTPSTPPEVLEERSKVVSEAEERIRIGETICTKVVEVVFTMWEALMDDDTMDNIN